MKPKLMTTSVNVLGNKDKFILNYEIRHDTSNIIYKTIIKFHCLDQPMSSYQKSNLRVHNIDKALFVLKNSPNDDSMLLVQLISAIDPKLFNFKKKNPLLLSKLKEYKKEAEIEKNKAQEILESQIRTIDVFKIEISLFKEKDQGWFEIDSNENKKEYFFNTRETTLKKEIVDAYHNEIEDLRKVSIELAEKNLKSKTRVYKPVYF